MLSGRLFRQRGVALEAAFIIFAAGNKLRPRLDEIGVGRAHLSRPVVGAGGRTIPIGTVRDERGRGAHPAREVGVLEVTQLLGPDRRLTGDHHDLLVRRELHHFAGSQELPRGLLPRDHDVGQPGCEPVARIVALGAQLGGRAQRVRDALGGALVVGGEGDPDMAVIENGVVLAIGFRDLIERLRDQEASHAVAGHEGERAFKEVEAP